MRRYQVQNPLEAKSPVFFGGQFWWVEHQVQYDTIARRITGHNVTVCNTTGDRYERNHADYGYPALMVDTEGQLAVMVNQTSVSVVEGRELPLACGPAPTYTYTNTALRKAFVAWQNQKRELCLRPADSGKLKRLDYDDTHVVMTGKEAVDMAPLVMGPSHGDAVSKYKGIKTNHVVIYRRGGDYRIMKLNDGNPLEVLLSPDGLTFLAVCRYAVYLIDVDAGN